MFTRRPLTKKEEKLFSMPQFYSTQNPQHRVDLQTAVLQGLAPDNGLYLPTELALLPTAVLQSPSSLSLQELAVEMSWLFLKDALSKSQVEEIVQDAINFSIPLISLQKNISVLELFHGPTCAFKDFGGRFMSRLLKHFLRQQKKELTILVATSGDTGSAVANGFYCVDGIRVIILYPSKKVSHIQEQQLTTLGNNIHAIEVQGTFDDCQSFVKKAFLDTAIQQHLNTTSANSINIARLIPQSFYYAYTAAQNKSTNPIVFSVPSGNYGNLTGGLFAKKAGIKIGGFIAASNENDIVPRYLENGIFSPQQSITTISNAMDVGNPSNFDRIENLYDKQLNKIKNDIVGYGFSDDATKQAMKKVYEQTQYVLDPHGAVAYLGVEKFLQQNPSSNAHFIALETAHPAKFGDIVKDVLGIEPNIPEQLKSCLAKQKVSTLMKADFEQFKNYLLAL